MDDRYPKTHRTLVHLELLSTFEDECRQISDAAIMILGALAYTRRRLCESAKEPDPDTLRAVRSAEEAAQFIAEAVDAIASRHGSSASTDAEPEDPFDGDPPPTLRPPKQSA